MRYRTEGSLLELTDPPIELDVDWVSRRWAKRMDSV